MLPSWCRDEIKVLRPGTRMERGTILPDWKNAQPITIGGCSVQPVSTASDRDGRTAVAEYTTLLAPPGADIRAGDRVEHDGTTYEVQGVPMKRRSPTGAASHIEITLAVWEG